MPCKAELQKYICSHLAENLTESTLVQYDSERTPIREQTLLRAQHAKLGGNKHIQENRCARSNVVFKNIFYSMVWTNADRSSVRACRETK